MGRRLRWRVVALAAGVLFLVLLGGPCTLRALTRPGEIGLNAYPSAGDPAATIDPQLLRANQDFAFRLFSDVVRQNPEQNVFISPASVGLALSMVYNGAGGATATAIADTLGVRGFALDELNQANADLYASLVECDPYVRLAITNALWLGNGPSPSREFLDDCDRFYAAEVSGLDLGDPSALATINRWVREQTRGKVEQALTSLDPETCSVLVNVVYFRGIWTTKFDPDETSDRPFHLADGTTKTVPMMARTDEMAFIWHETFQGVRLPYGDERIALYVLVPHEDRSLSGLCDTLDGERWEGWLRTGHTFEGTVVLPRVAMEFGCDLRDALSELGMGIAFDPSAADFSKALLPGFTGPLWLEQVLHRTLLEIDETGTRAVGVSVASLACAKAGQLIADRPFLCAIRDDATGTLLFVGAIYDPC